MGQQTVHTSYRCPCGAGRVVLTTTAFAGGGLRKLHTELVQCPICKGHYSFKLAPGQPAAAIAEDRRTGAEHALQPSED